MAPLFDFSKETNNSFFNTNNENLKFSIEDCDSQNRNLTISIIDSLFEEKRNDLINKEKEAAALIEEINKLGIGVKK